MLFVSTLTFCQLSALSFILEFITVKRPGKLAVYIVGISSVLWWLYVAIVLLFFQPLLISLPAPPCSASHSNASSHTHGKYSEAVALTRCGGLFFSQAS